MSLGKNKPMAEFPLLKEKDGIPLFYPFISPRAKAEVIDTLESRWIGQGPKVDIFESKFKEQLVPDNFPIATGSGTDSLHLAYLLADITEGDEVITPVFTCTATNLPILYAGATPIFADIDPYSMNINVNDIEHRINEKTKAIVAVDYGGLPANYKKLKEICKKHNLFLISDAAQSIGTKYNYEPISNIADFTAYSFQAIKTITTGDGGMLVMKDKSFLDKSKRLRWFGIDRSSKQKGTWENDIREIGYKYQMSDLAACLGISALEELDTLIAHRQALFKAYKSEIIISDIKVISPNFSDGTVISPWLCTVLVKEGRIDLMKKLRSHGIESAQVHYRNDRYSVFGGRKSDLPIMDEMEEKYLVLPLHHKISVEQVHFISSLINEGW